MASVKSLRFGTIESGERPLATAPMANMRWKAVIAVNDSPAARWNQRMRSMPPRRSIIQRAQPASKYFWGRPVSDRMMNSDITRTCSVRWRTEKRVR